MYKYYYLTEFWPAFRRAQWVKLYDKLKDEILAKWYWKRPKNNIMDQGRIGDEI